MEGFGSTSGAYTLRMCAYKPHLELRLGGGCRITIIIMHKPPTATGARRQPTRPQEANCAVCHLKLIESDTQERLACSGCSAVLHKNCYSPSFEEKGKIKFKCDECKHQGKGKEKTCLVCGRGRDSGLLKNVGGDEWAHVLCALASPRMKLASYKTLVFHAGKAPQNKPTKGGARCVGCQQEKPSGLPCTIEACQNYMHLNCVALSKSQEIGQDYSAFLTIGLLDKHQNSLLTHLKKNMEQKIHLKGLELYPVPPPELRYFVCQLHNDNAYPWCHCGGEGPADIDKNELQSFECDRCSRWFHSECLNNKNASNKEILCSGCMSNNPYERNMTLPQLVAKAMEAEGGTFDKEKVRFLDHFCLKLSLDIEKVIVQKGTYEVERYYLRKALGNTDLANPDQLGTALEMLYYLTKRQRKSKDDISPQEIQQIIKAESKSNKYEWNNKSETRVEKRFKTKLEDLLKAIRKDGTRDVKLKLQNFIKKNYEVVGRTHKDIAADLGELVKSLQASEGWREAYSAFPNKDPQRHLIEFFYEMKFTQEEAVNILGALRTLFNPKGKGAILQSDYRAIAPIFEKVLPEQKRKIFQGLFDNLTRDLCLRKAYKEKQQVKMDLQSRLKTSRTGKERDTIKQSILSNRLLVTSASPLMQIEKDSIELSILRRKVIRKSQDPSPHQLPEVKMLLNKLLELDARNQGLTPQERRDFEQTQIRLSFYQSLANFSGEAMVPEGSSSSSMLDQNSEVAPHQSEGKRIQRLIRAASLRERAISAIMDWKWMHSQALTVALAESYKIAINSISFQEAERAIIFHFCQSIVGVFNRAIHCQQMTPSGHILEKLHKIAEYSQCIGSYPIIRELYGMFEVWKRDLDTIDDIPLALQTPKQAQSLLEIVSSRLQSGQQIGGAIDFSSQLRKLRLVRLWCQLSLKLQQGNKATITSIQSTKSLMDRIRYPNNCLRRRIEALEAESKSLNRRISQFLEKPKNVEMEVYEEEKIMAGKMTLGDALELQKELEASQLDVEVELQELVEEIKDFKSFPKNISGLIQNSSLQDLQALRRRLFENSFRLQGEGPELYHRLLMKITQLKCNQYEPGTQITKKEYFKLLNSGPKGAEIFSETINVHRGYKDVERAEREFFAAKQKLENLLPSDCRKVKEDLKDDPTQLAKVTRWHTLSEKAKERYKTLRNSRVDISQFSTVESQLQRLPLNNQNILQEISLLRRQLEDLTKKVRNFLQSSDSTMLYNSPYVMDLVNQYHSIGVRNQYLDKFQRLFSTARMVYDFAKEPLPERYPGFHALCEDYPELGKSDEIYRIRESIFEHMAGIYMRSDQNMMEVGCVLFVEGGYLMRHANKVPKVLEILREVENKFNKWGGKGEDEDEDEMEGLEDEQGMDDEDQEEDEEDEEMMDEDIDEDSYLSEESSSPSNPNRKLKRPRPNQVVELDDD